MVVVEVEEQRPLAATSLRGLPEGCCWLVLLAGAATCCC